MVMLVLLLLAGGGTLFLADVALGPAKADVAAMKRLTALFGDRGDLAPGSEVRLRSIPEDPARQGPGIHLEVRPAAPVLARPDGLRGLVLALARELPAAYGSGATPPRWMRMRVFLDGDAHHDTYLVRDADGTWGEPEPPLPAAAPR